MSVIEEIIGNFFFILSPFVIEIFTTFSFIGDNVNGRLSFVFTDFAVSFYPSTSGGIHIIIIGRVSDGDQ